MAGISQVLYISHGGGPLPLLGDAAHKELVQQLEHYARKIEKPEAIVVVSAHWEADVPTVTAGANPNLIYDYYGFPEESYHIQYPAPGSPALAQALADAFAAHGLPLEQDTERGFDHGMFVPLKLMYPNADIPVVQLSLVKSLDADMHVRMGEALQALKGKNILLLGSGFSFHNMKMFFTSETAEIRAQNLAFEHWLQDTLGNPDLTEHERKARLVGWQQAPSARFCHPREEHLLPLHLCYGAAAKVADELNSAKVLGKSAGLFYWRC
ncbi:DODA-type extradiol aromatic ring-opening family dioxygenase [Aliidiomarina celeris]|uniref:DODA-type extradiol aromatic ring-opening family dioxygenase n=1 Tax=Aliidiomarina celeris TaxID=2249428 RepID=UPI000DE95D6E|nr:class III extradiol ring-cleavage dioxygenase [Aliidiomarina celeris]